MYSHFKQYTYNMYERNETKRLIDLHNIQIKYTFSQYILYIQHSRNHNFQYAPFYVLHNIVAMCLNLYFLYIESERSFPFRSILMFFETLLKGINIIVYYFRISILCIMLVVIKFSLFFSFFFHHFLYNCTQSRLFNPFSFLKQQ